MLHLRLHVLWEQHSSAGPTSMLGYPVLLLDSQVTQPYQETLHSCLHWTYHQSPSEFLTASPWWQKTQHLNSFMQRVKAVPPSCGTDSGDPQVTLSLHPGITELPPGPSQSHNQAAAVEPDISELNLPIDNTIVFAICLWIWDTFWIPAGTLESQNGHQFSLHSFTVLWLCKVTPLLN
jgi:hypothetical protein